MVALAPGETAQIVGPTLCLTTRRLFAWDRDAKQVIERPISQLAIVRRISPLMRRDHPIVEVVLVDGRVFSGEVQPNAALDYIAEQLLNSPQRLEMLGTTPQSTSPAQWQARIEPASPFSGCVSIGLLFLLFGWIPILGPFASGFVAGRKVDGVLGSVTAALLPALILGDVVVVGILSSGYDGEYTADSERIAGLATAAALNSILIVVSVVLGARVGRARRS